MVRNSPFSLGRPIDVANFAGRRQQVEELLRVAAISAHGAFNVAFISGERGIGKSSLAKMVCHLAERDYKMATAYVALSGTNDMLGLARLTLQAVVHDSTNKAWMETTAQALHTYIKRVGVFGVEVEINMSAEDLQAIVDNFPSEMGGLLERVDSDRHGLIIVMDDIDGLIETPAFAHWLKNMVDRAAVGTRAVPSLFLLICGQEEHRCQLMEHNPSVAHIFQPTVIMESWTEAEARDFLIDGFRNGGLVIPRDLLHLCARFSGGLPMLAHEIGDAVWKRVIRQDQVSLIDAAVENGIRDAVENVGRQHLPASVLAVFHSDQYRLLLHKIGLQIFLPDCFVHKELRAQLNLSADESAALDDFIGHMCAWGVITPDEDRSEHDAYCFSNLLYRLYFVMATYQIGIERVYSQ